MKKYLLCGVLCALLIGVAGAKNTSKQTKEDGKDTGAYVFTDKVLVPVTPVKDQAKSGTCWSFSGTAMAESELLRRRERRLRPFRNVDRPPYLPRKSDQIRPPAR